jgi:hypothetical protein
MHLLQRVCKPTARMQNAARAQANDCETLTDEQAIEMLAI